MKEVFSNLKVLFVLLLSVQLVLTGCGGTILKEPLALEITQPLVTASDQNVLAELIWVIVRDGPGTWAKNADWDEYLVKVVNESGEAIRIIDITIVDSLGVRQATNADYRELVNESKETTKRYKDSNLKVKAGVGVGTMMAVGGATMLGASAVYGVVAATTWPMMTYGAAGAGASGAAVGAATVVGGLVVLVPAVVGISIVRSNNRKKVAKKIWKRHTLLPITINSHEDLLLDIFYPLAPSPTQLEITYMVAGVEETLVVNTSEALNGLHLFQLEGVSEEIIQVEQNLITPEVNEIGRNGTFIAYDDGTVLDTETNLMWWSKSIAVSDFYNAQYKSKTLKGGGYSNWRVPSIQELKTVYVESSKHKYKTNNFITLISPYLLSGNFVNDVDATDRIQYIDFKSGSVGSYITYHDSFAPGRMTLLPVRKAN